MFRSISFLSSAIFFTSTLLFVSLGSGSFICPAMAGGDCPLISQTLAARHGMERQWHTQVPLDSSNNRVTHLTLVAKSETSPDTLFVQTERSILFAINAETGKMLWAKVIGRPDLISCAVGCNDQMVGVLNGSTIYILNRLNGRIIWKRNFPGVPASGPVLSKRYAYVPLLDGCVAAYPIRKDDSVDEKSSRKKEVLVSEGDEVQTAAVKVSNASRLILSQEKIEPLICSSIHRIETQPVLIQDDDSADRLAWINKRGMYVGAISNKGNRGFKLDYWLTTSLSFRASPAFVASRFTHPDETKRESNSDASEEGPFARKGSVEDVPIFGALLAASTDGQVSAVQAGNGGMLWEYHVGQPINQPVAAIGSQAYVVSQFGLMLCFDVRTGKKLWETRNVSQFVAQTKDRLYVLDSSGERVSILRVSDGSQIDQLPISGFSKVISNDQTDRLFFISDTGLVQSLRQRGVKAPIRH